jgi:hypothetical protein
MRSAAGKIAALMLVGLVSVAGASSPPGHICHIGKTIASGSVFLVKMEVY